MPSKGKPFVVYRRGVGFIAIVPRGVMGWAQFTAWVALLVAAVWWFVDYSRDANSGQDFGVALFLFFMGLIGWSVCLLWWMFARSETVDIVVLKRDRQRAQRKKERGS